MRIRVVHLAGMAATLSLATACATSGSTRASRYPLSASIADTIRSERLAPGVWLHSLVRNTGPLRAYILDVDRTACVSVRALKGAETAVGRTTTSALLRTVSATDIPLAAVNADFFLFAPPGVPVGALMSEGRLLAGPVARPVIAFDDASRPTISAMTVRGAITSSRGRMAIATWNRPTASAIGVVDAAWGQPLDSLTRPGAVMLIPVNATHYRLVALSDGHDARARADTLMLVGSARASLLLGDTVQVNLSLVPTNSRNAGRRNAGRRNAGQRNAGQRNARQRNGMPLNVVGGFPLLVRDSVIVPSVDSAGAVSFRAVNPRTAVGYAENGNRVLFAVIDGRQAGYSVGTTTRETAALMRDLGARDALNLDGGGSSAMVVRDVTTGTVRVVNKPSDVTGERPVANALAVVGVCKR